VRVVAATNLVPREQHLCLFTSLYTLRRFVQVSLLVGARWESEVATFLYKQLNVVHSYSEGIGPLGRARRALLEEVVLLQSDFILFLDDDAVLTPDQFVRMQQLGGENVGCIAIQSDYEGRMKELRGRPAFDFTCTMVPGRYVAKVVEDEDFLALLGRLTTGPDFLMMDWRLRREGCFFNVLTDVVLHVFVQDRYKKWGRWSQERWDRLHDGIVACSSVSALEGFLEQEGCLG